MLNEFSRTELLLGADAMCKLKDATVAIFGIGGVGSYTAEALARSGIGGFALFDDDKVCLTNINRQLIATRKTVGKQKIEVMRDRILDINPSAEVELNQTFYGAENADEFDLSKYTYVVDAIDTVSSKLILIERAKAAGVSIISCMGAGNKLDPTRFEVTDIYKTSVCPLARVMRNELRKRGVKSLKVVYSKEPALTPIDDDANSCKHNCICPPDTKRKCTIRRQVPGSVSFVPSVAGLILAGEVIKDIAGLTGTTD
ncbi:tRNA threonylcarbamoyladenosine dehydratase [Oscillospiraceae bacterium PP1C4]